MVHQKRVFDFLLDLSEVNDNLGENHFGDVEAVRPMLEFRRLLSRDLINKPYLSRYYFPSEGCNSNRNKHTCGKIIIRVH